MKLVKADDDFARNGRTTLKLQGLIDEFMESDMLCAEIVFESWEYKSNKTCYAAMYSALKRSKRRCKVFTTGGRIYIAKLD